MHIILDVHIHGLIGYSTSSSFVRSLRETSSDGHTPVNPVFSSTTVHVP